MPDIATVLKEEIARLARKELKAQAQEWRRTAAHQRAQIAALRGRVEALERQVKRLGKAGTRGGAEAQEPGEEGVPRRFSAKGFASQRKRLGLSAAEYAALLGVSAQSVYKWEDGKARPRARQLDAIAALRGIGKREAAARLSALQAAR